MHPDRLVLAICRFAVAFVWIYQGLVPKLLGPDATELAMNATLGLDAAARVQLSYVGGGLEIVLGLAVLCAYRQRWPWLATIGGMLGLYVFTLLFAPAVVVAAFNSTTVNLSVVALALVALVVLGKETVAAAPPAGEAGLD
ncbi:MAG: hypothetical protein K0S16_1457 [Moraxellaceae bacterium]|jgi:uncharacterized membrane protein YphA (DoxX/SURF4 family)|nr:hypothetical protein [Moraxellaceae bacterium]